ncbi:uncharacterized protein LOC142338085 [Convolutriloba macropyga]|uniref:uncharacterized protein LOC142338085 n=1 Tax=Convolutriloba macropyga TaxID=536237 RepID=UPI003F52774F
MRKCKLNSFFRFIPCFNSFTPPKIKLREGFEHHFVEGSLPEGFKVGIDAEYVKQAFDPQVSECVLGMAEKLKAKGAEIVPISIPEIFESFRAFVVLFGSEGIYHLTYGEFKEFEDEYSSSLILLHTMSSKLKSAYYHLAGQQKTRMIYFIREILQKVDVMLFPGTGMKTPFINPSDLKYGCVNLSRETEIARYTWLGNLTGMPAVSIPVCWFQMTNKPDQIADQKDKLTKDTFVGQTDDKDIPCSIQVCGRWWREDDCFLTARAIESIRDAEMEKRDKVKFQLNYTVSP